MSDTERAMEPRSLRRLLIGTDLSSRADRAIRRGALLAAASGAEVLVVHAVDDDQPRSLVEMECREAIALLRDQLAGLAELQGLRATPLMEEGDPFEAVLRAAEARDADLVVLGEHRRRPLRDIFAGTTVERVMRHGHRPVLMVNQPPAGPYRHVLAATDLSEHSARALRAAVTSASSTGATSPSCTPSSLPGSARSRSPMRRPRASRRMRRGRHATWRPRSLRLLGLRGDRGAARARVAALLVRRASSRCCCASR
jgi:nucleotide-binding universal stress UspA family protein